MVVGGKSKGKPQKKKEIVEETVEEREARLSRRYESKESLEHKQAESEEEEEKPRAAEGSLNTGAPQMSRREKEAIAKEKARQAYFKAQMEGKTDQARADLARLALIRKQREEAAAKRQAEQQAKADSSVKANSLRTID